MFYIHVYINSSFIFTFFKKWILECIQSYNFSAYFSETKHCCCRLVAESWLTLCDLMACSLPSSSVHGISQARILECVAISFSRGSPRPRDRNLISCINRQILYHWVTSEVKWKLLSHVRPFAIPWTIQSIELPGQNTGVGSLFILQGIFPTQGPNPGLPHCR